MTYPFASEQDSTTTRGKYSSEDRDPAMPRSAGKLRALGFTCAVLVAAASFIAPQHALALDSSPVCGAQAVNQIGWDTADYGAQPAGYEGASATITDRGGYVLCSEGTPPGVNNWNNGAVNFSYPWSMIYSNNGYLVQSGIIYGYSNGCPHLFAETMINNQVASESNTPNDCVASGNVHRFWEHDTGTSIFGDVDNTALVVLQTSISQWAGVNVAFNSETNFGNTNIPGSSSAPEDWTSLQVQGNRTNSFYDACGNVYLAVHTRTTAVVITHRRSLVTTFSHGQVKAKQCDATELL